MMKNVVYVDDIVTAIGFLTQLNEIDITTMVVQHDAKGTSEDLENNAVVKQLKQEGKSNSEILIKLYCNIENMKKYRELRL